MTSTILRKPTRWLLKFILFGFVFFVIWQTIKFWGHEPRWRKNVQFSINSAGVRGIYDNTRTNNNDVIRIVVVACPGKGDHVTEETVTMIKSALIFTKRRIEFHLFTKDLEEDIKEEVLTWSISARKKLGLYIHKLHYPLNPDEVEEMKDWWGPCASFRLFLPAVMKNVDSVLYVDTDVTFLGGVDDLWDEFKNFGPGQVGGLAPRVGWDFQVPKTNPNFIELPNGHVTQVNSGVFLMNLTRMRTPIFKTHPNLGRNALSWSKELLLPLYHMFISDMHGDQNLINTVFHFNPKLLYFISCRFNYHHKFCIDAHSDRQCGDAERYGAAVVHGNANTYQNNFAPAFRAVHDAMREFQLGEQTPRDLYENIKTRLEDPGVERADHCGNKTHLLLRNLETLL